MWALWVAGALRLVDRKPDVDGRAGEPDVELTVRAVTAMVVGSVTSDAGDIRLLPDGVEDVLHEVLHVGSLRRERDVRFVAHTLFLSGAQCSKANPKLE